MTAPTGPVDITNLASALGAYRQAQTEIGKWEMVRDAARAAIEERLHGAEAGAVDGQVAVTYKRITRTTPDVKRLRADHPDLVAQYDRTTEVRPFKVLD